MKFINCILLGIVSLILIYLISPIKEALPPGAGSSNSLYIQGPRNTICPLGQQISSLSECQTAIKELGLENDHLWDGPANDDIPAGCAWTSCPEPDDCENQANWRSLSHWNDWNSSRGNPRADLHPICKIPSISNCKTENVTCPSECLTPPCETGGGSYARNVTNASGSNNPADGRLSCKDWCSPSNGSMRFCMAASYLGPGGAAAAIGRGVNNTVGAIDCTGCSAQNGTTCSACDTGYTLKNNACSATQIDNCKTQTDITCSACDTGYTLSSNSCGATPIQNCKTQKETTCLICDDGYSLSNNQCSPTPIVNCDDQTLITCSKCKTGYTLKDNKCPATSVANCKTQQEITCSACNDGYTLTLNKCSPTKIDNCKTQTETKCLECDTNYDLKNNQCIAYPKITNCEDQVDAKCEKCDTGYEIEGFANVKEGFREGLETCIIQPNVDYRGADLHTATADSAAACCAACQADANCMSYTFLPPSVGGPACYLKDKVGGANGPQPPHGGGYAANFTSGYFASSIPGCVTTPGVDYAGADIGVDNSLGADVTDCCAACRANPKCKAWTWAPGHRGCYLKNKIGGANGPQTGDRNATFISGYPTPTTPPPAANKCPAGQTWQAGSGTISNKGPYKDQCDDPTSESCQRGDAGGSGGRALRYGPHEYGYTKETCAAACPTYKYIALQDAGHAGGSEGSWCSCDNDWTRATRGGPASCGVGGGASCNYIYEVDRGKCVANKIPNCQTQTGTTCSVCDTGYTLSNNECKLIPKIPNCQTQTGTTCSACSTGYILKNNTCSPAVCNCPNGKVPNPCTKNGTQCLSCNKGYNLVNGQCVLTGPSCNCLNGKVAYPCTKDGTECSSCNSGYTLKNGECITSTDPSGSDQNSCSKINYGKIANCKTQNEKKCIVCDSNFKLVNNQCISYPLIPGCLDQQGDICTKCKNEYNLINNECVSQKHKFKPPKCNSNNSGISSQCPQIPEIPASMSTRMGKKLITCPSWECNPNCVQGNGKCIRGMCVCNPGWMGKQCETKIQPSSCSTLPRPTKYNLIDKGGKKLEKRNQHLYDNIKAESISALTTIKNSLNNILPLYKNQIGGCPPEKQTCPAPGSMTTKELRRWAEKLKQMREKKRCTPEECPVDYEDTKKKVDRIVKSKKDWEKNKFSNLKDTGLYKCSV